jgi:transposase-like protein
MMDFNGDIIKERSFLTVSGGDCKYGASDRDLEEMILERGIEVDHTALSLGPILRS